MEAQIKMAIDLLLEMNNKTTSVEDMTSLYQVISILRRLLPAQAGKSAGLSKDIFL